MSAVLTFLSLESVDFNLILKKSKPFQARLFYIVIALALTELLASFTINFFEMTGIIL
jgi:uncharacterized membrane protein YwzB